MIEVWGHLYTATLIGLALYAVHTLVLVVLYLWHRRAPSPPVPAISHYPVVTLQIPLRNERYVVERVLGAVSALAWPQECLEIQVLDDSDDETRALVDAEVARLQAQGMWVRVVRRSSPAGHKAGALAMGLQEARGEFIAIFDADFCPLDDFLQRTVPYLLADASLGMVQARWGHLNATYSLVTRAQALALDAHFTVEHVARNRSGLLMNFNGTAGVWRRAAIEDAGGWQSDTVAEDLDLSYRAQLAGWRMLYLPDAVAPAELPPLVSAFKQQQYRWAKGAAQTLRKLARRIVRAPRLRWYQKLMALLHLSGYFMQPLLLCLLLLTLPVAFYAPDLPTLAAFLGGVMTVPPLLYLLGQVSLYRDWPKRILTYPVLMLLGLGIAWSTTLALVDGFLHWGGDFVRTPKFCLQGQSGEWRTAKYRLRVNWAWWGEVVLILYILLVLKVVVTVEAQQLLPFVLAYLVGEVLTVGMTWLENRSKGEI